MIFSVLLIILIARIIRSGGRSRGDFENTFAPDFSASMPNMDTFVQANNSNVFQSTDFSKGGAGGAGGGGGGKNAAPPVELSADAMELIQLSSQRALT